MPASYDITHRANECVGTPYHPTLAQPGMGMSCLGLVWWCYKDAGVNLGPWSELIDHPERAHGKRLTTELDKIAVKVWDRDERPVFPWMKSIKSSDIVLMAWGKYPMHMGIAIVGKHGWDVIHADDRTEKVIRHGLREKWADRVTHLYRFEDVI